MNAITAICFLGLAALAAARPEVTYTDRYDNVNLNDIITNKRLLIPYLKCILDQGKCSPDGRELKSHIREALENYCAKCTRTQKDGTRKMIGHIINHEPEYWNQLVAKYDPKRKYVVKYEKELRTVVA